MTIEQKISQNRCFSKDEDEPRMDKHGAAIIENGAISVKWRGRRASRRTNRPAIQTGDGVWRRYAVIPAYKSIYLPIHYGMTWLSVQMANNECLLLAGAGIKRHYHISLSKAAADERKVICWVNEKDDFANVLR